MKNKMLEDQNDTIKRLKTNLENKIRESQGSVSTLESRLADLEDKLAEARENIRVLSGALDTQRETLSSEFELTYREERGKLLRQVADLEGKLQDRNDSILQIEQEVRKVKKVFKQKEEALINQESVTIREKDTIITQLKRDLKASIELNLTQRI